MPKFHLYVIHTANLVHRQSRLHGTIQSIREMASARGYEFRSILVLTPDVSALHAKIPELSARIKYDKTGYPDLDSMLSVLNMEQLSNFEKHREAWRRIQREVTDPNDVCMVIEDDAFIIPEFSKNLQAFIAKPYQDAWDFYSLSISIQSDKRVMKILECMGNLASKCAYAVRPSVVQKLLDETEIIRFTMRNQLSYIFRKREDIMAMVSNEQCIMEGTKLGIYTSSIHPNNLLSFNKEFMELFQIAQSESPSLELASRIFDQVKHIGNPDVMHIYGVILFKCGRVKEASQVLSVAIDQMQKQHGLMNNQSDLLNNSINMYEHMQWDLPEYLNTPSKYDAILT